MNCRWKSGKSIENRTESSASRSIAVLPSATFQTQAICQTTRPGNQKQRWVACGVRVVHGIVSSHNLITLLVFLLPFDCFSVGLTERRWEETSGPVRSISRENGPLWPSCNKSPGAPARNDMQKPDNKTRTPIRPHTSRAPFVLIRHRERQR